MPGPYNLPTNRTTGGGSPASDMNAANAALNEATPSSTPSVLVERDANGRAQFAEPATDLDAANKKYVDDNIGIQSDVITRIVVSSDPDTALADGELLVVVPVLTDNVAPSAPTGLNATTINSTAIDLTWSAATDNVAVTGYEYRIGTGTPVDVGNVLTTDVTALTPATSYTFEVRAYDAEGNRSAWSAADSATTDAASTPTYTENFSTGQTLDAAPSGWTSRWAAFTTLIIDDTHVTSDNRMLKATAPGSSTRCAASFDAAGTAHADAEMLARYKPNANTGAGRLLIRGGGGSGAETGILAYVSSTGVVTIGEYNAGAATTLSPTGTGPGSPSNASWYRIRFRVSGNQAMLKVWNESGAEPSSWQVTVTIPNVSAAGWVGIMAFNGGTTFFDWITVAYDGGTAPTPS